jgi:hypothetical protein
MTNQTGWNFHADAPSVVDGYLIGSDPTEFAHRAT